ncbi:hypothetical protein [Gloeocapsopsis dulcis]|uniref:Uncharacterized protein n=1 Tax=Gloeocapsopsis dulcis AAB1 = 1H9 TaxID=1433147 RepID=A0A6N8FRT7_9CHRO|nr:hypothetical protein [Gloeocapsopsis dulcis]MUL34917.1 hypothetical protein [Gloeocapsopsis dulcis AAB1 = 1H9]WNN90011.1 hypothetical protein P0S91_02615 [Gloeocapsopsis dulcis]
MVDSQNIAQIGLFSVGILTFFCANALPQKVLAEHSVMTSNLTDLETGNRQDSRNLHHPQDLKLAGNITSALTTQSIEESNFTNTKLDQLPNVSNNNVNNEYQTASITNSQQIEVSHSAVDLLAENSLEKQFLIGEVDLDTLCRTFPLNSRCAGYQRTSEQQSQQQLIQRLSQSERQNLETRLLERLALTPEAPVRSGFALGGKVSTLGVGIEGVGAISPNFNGRLGFNYLGFGSGFTENNIDYDGDLQLLNATGMLDWFPSSTSGFRVTGGVVYQNNRVDAIARPAEVLEIGGIEFPLAAVGQLEGSLTFPNTIAPYIGIGYGNPVRRGSAFSFNIDLGVLFPGSPQANLQATGPGVDLIGGIPVVNNLLEDAIAQEEEQIEDNVSWLGVYPVLFIGVSYQF